MSPIRRSWLSSVFIPIVIPVVFCISWLIDVSMSACSERSNRRMKDSMNDFGVLIDAGSTGTRIWIYNWPRSRAIDEDKQVPPIECIYSYKLSKGLADFADDLHQLRNITLFLIKKAEQQIPSAVYSTTSIFLMATAGMRLLLEEKAISVIEELDALFRNKTFNPFMYDSPHNARILSGEEEGVFAWIAVNYLSKQLTHTDADLYQATSGILELGGASTQIAFIPRGSVLSDKFPVFIGGEKYPIYVHSYLHYGQDYVDRWIQNRIVHSQSNLSTLNNPCMLKGEKVQTPEGRTFIGTGNPLACVTLLERFVYKTESHQCHPKPCAIGNVYQPNVPPNQTFYTIGAFYFILKDLNIIRPNGTFTPKQVYEAAFHFCSKDYDELKRKLQPRHDSEKFISKPCSIGLYTSLLFTRGYGFNNDTQQIIAAEMINGHPIDWTLGAMIYENDYRMTSQCRKNEKNGEGNISANHNKSVSNRNPSSSAVTTAKSAVFCMFLSFYFIALCMPYVIL